MEAAEQGVSGWWALRGSAGGVSFMKRRNGRFEGGEALWVSYSPIIGQDLA